MHAEIKRLPKANAFASPFAGRKILLCVASLYLIIGGISAWNIIVRTTESSDAIDHVLSLYSLKNEGARSLDHFKKDHPLLGWLFGSPVRHMLELPPSDQAAEALTSDVRSELTVVREKSFQVAWWSWSLLSLSLAYFVGIVTLERRFTSRIVLFCLTSISTVCFVIGVLAPAMVMWTAPAIPMEGGNLEFVLQHEVRGIAAIIWELLTGGQWVIGALLLIFSIITPLTKACLTFFVTFSQNKMLNFKIGQFIHTIGKWSMADVFVAGVFLALFALKAQEATKSIPCLGLYFFILYCLISMTTTELLVHSEATRPDSDSSTHIEREVGMGTIRFLYLGLICCMALSAVYTYQQYTLNLRERVVTPKSPHELNNATLLLPVHK